MITQRSFGTLQDGEQAILYSLANSRGEQVQITNFGATIVAIKVLDCSGGLGDVVLGYDDAIGYACGSAYFGATIGRYANRIANASFVLGRETYTLSMNDGKNHLHGGHKGLSKVCWDVVSNLASNPDCLTLSCLSKDMDEGYPGNLELLVSFYFSDEAALRIEYFARTDKSTIINLTNHSYFNLKGSGDILDHQLSLAASHFTPVAADLIPTGEIRTVEGSAFDFREAVMIGRQIDSSDIQQKLAGGFDHNWVLQQSTERSLQKATTLYEPSTRRSLEIWTTEPGIQFYSGNQLNGDPGKRGQVYTAHSGLCLETQHFPDSPNHPNFPSTVLQAGCSYSSTTIYRFFVSKDPRDSTK